MDDLTILKGQHVTSPKGRGDIIETISDKVVVELENGATCIFPAAQIEFDNREIKQQMHR